MNSTLYTTITQTSSKQFPGDAVGLKTAKMTNKFSHKLSRFKVTMAKYNCETKNNQTELLV